MCRVLHITAASVSYCLKQCFVWQDLWQDLFCKTLVLVSCRVCVQVCAAGLAAMCACSCSSVLKPLYCPLCVVFWFHPATDMGQSGLRCMPRGAVWACTGDHSVGAGEACMQLAVMQRLCGRLSPGKTQRVAVQQYCLWNHHTDLEHQEHQHTRRQTARMSSETSKTSCTRHTHSSTALQQKKQAVPLHISPPKPPEPK